VTASKALGAILLGLGVELVTPLLKLTALKGGWLLEGKAVMIVKLQRSLTEPEEVLMYNLQCPGGGHEHRDLRGGGGSGMVGTHENP
jgi:hypothetical protein